MGDAIDTSPQPSPSRREFLTTVGAGTALALCGGKMPTAWGEESTSMARKDLFDFDRTHQTIENFGASDCWYCEPAGCWEDEAAKNRIADLLFSREKGAGLTAWRFNLGGGIDETIHIKHRTAETFEVSPGAYDLTRCPGQRWFAQAARARGVGEFIAFVNSPPRRMTISGHTYGVKDDKVTTNLKAGCEGDFAVYVADIVERFQGAPEELRIPFTHLSPINEPEIAWDHTGQEGCRYSVEDVRRTLKAVGAELARRRTKVQMVAPDCNTSPSLIEGRRYVDSLARHPDTQDILHKRLCYHDYDVVRFTRDAVRQRRRIGEEMLKLPGWTLWMSEYCVLEHGRDLTMDTALRLARLMHFDLTEANVTAWQWWIALSIVDYKDGLIYVDLDQREISPAKMLWVMGQYSRFVRPGAKRIHFTGENEYRTQVLASAYRHDDDRQLACVYVNLTDKTAEVMPAIQSSANVSLTDWMIHRTSDVVGEDIKQVGTVSQGAAISLPGRSVTTLTCGWNG